MKTKPIQKKNSCFPKKRSIQSIKRPKLIITSFLILFIFSFSTQVITAQDTTKTITPKTTRVPIKKPRVKVKTKTTRPIKPAVQQNPQQQSNQVQIQAPKDIKQLDLSKLDDALHVSQKYSRLLVDNGTYIDERGYHGVTFDLIKKQNGDFSLAYSASTENLDIYTKGVIMTLKPDLSQKSTAMIITKPNDELRRIKISEFSSNNISITYTVNDTRCLNSKGSRDNSLTVLKHVNISSNGQVKTRNIDDKVGKIDFFTMHKPPGTSSITIAYNHNKKGKLALANMDLGSHNEICNIRELPLKESYFYGQAPTMVHPAFKSFEPMENDFLIFHDKPLTSPVWDLKTNGLKSRLKDVPVWPLLVVNGFTVADSHGDLCNCNNDPYTIYEDAGLLLENIINAIPLKNGDLGLIEQNENTTYFNIFDSQLQRKFNKVFIAESIHMSSLQYEKIDDNKILFFYKTKVNSNTMEYRVTIYNHETNEVVWSGDQVLWQSTERFNWDIVHKLVRIDDNRLVAVCFKEEDGHYKHQQTLEYRILTLNANM